MLSPGEAEADKAGEKSHPHVIHVRTAKANKYVSHIVHQMLICSTEKSGTGKRGPGKKFVHQGSLWQCAQQAEGGSHPHVRPRVNG